MRFRVQLERPVQYIDGRPFNPFLKSLDLYTRLTMTIREWEIDAESEQEVRRYLAEAFENDIPNVSGFRLRSIEQIKP